jgi:hypothetical protein
MLISTGHFNNLWTGDGELRAECWHHQQQAFFNSHTLCMAAAAAGCCCEWISSQTARPESVEIFLKVNSAAEKNT